MQLFNNIKLSKKLYISFFIMVVLIAVIGYIGIRNMETINSNAADVTN